MAFSFFSFFSFCLFFPRCPCSWSSCWVEVFSKPRAISHIKTGHRFLHLTPQVQILVVDHLPVFGCCMSATCTCLCRSVHLTGTCNLAVCTNVHTCRTTAPRSHLVQVGNASSEWPACHQCQSIHEE